MIKRRGTVTGDELTYADLRPGTFFVFSDEAKREGEGFVISETVHMKTDGKFTSVCKGKIDCRSRDESQFRDKKVILVEFGIQGK